jgi:hypothetical protein
MQMAVLLMPEICAVSIPETFRACNSLELSKLICAEVRPLTCAEVIALTPAASKLATRAVPDERIVPLAPPVYRLMSEIDKLIWISPLLFALSNYLN